MNAGQVIRSQGRALLPPTPMTLASQCGNGSVEEDALRKAGCRVESDPEGDGMLLAWSIA